MLKPIFRMICNATAFNGGERTAIDIMKLMYGAGYKIELIPLLNKNCRDTINIDFSKNIFFEYDLYHYLDFTNETHRYPCDILFFLVNDSIIRHHKERINLDFINNIEAKRRVMCLNYSTQYAGSYDMVRGWDLYICQNSKLLNNLTCELGIEIKSKILYPPVDLQPFLEKEYNRDSKLNLIRHSSQGDRKYNDDIHVMIAHIYNEIKNVEIHLMPAPSFLYDNRVNIYPYNALSPVNFLELGNLFWYFVPNEKFTEGCPRVVLEAMASGLPIICNNNGALADIVNYNIGWNQVTWNYGMMTALLCEISESDLREKGQNARQWIKENITTDKWVEAIIGKIDFAKT